MIQHMLALTTLCRHSVTDPGFVLCPSGWLHARQGGEARGGRETGKGERHVTHTHTHIWSHTCNWTHVTRGKRHAALNPPTHPRGPYTSPHPATVSLLVCVIMYSQSHIMLLLFGINDEGRGGGKFSRPFRSDKLWEACHSKYEHTHKCVCVVEECGWRTAAVKVTHTAGLLTCT